MPKKKKLIIAAGFFLLLALFFFVGRPFKGYYEKKAGRIYQAAAAALQAGNIHGSLKDFQEIIRKYNRTSYAEDAYRQTILIINDRFGQRKEAIKLAKEYYRKFPASAWAGEALYIIAHNSHFFTANDREARKYSSIILDKYPGVEKSYKVYPLLSDIAARAGDYSGVIRYNNLLLEKYPGKIDADNYLLNNVETYYRLGRIDEAYKEIQKIKDKNQPNIKNSLPYHFVLLAKKPSPEINLQLSRIYAGMGMKEKSAHYAAQAKKSAGRK